MKFSTVAVASILAIGLFLTGHLLMAVGMTMVVIVVLIQSAANAVRLWGGDAR